MVLTCLILVSIILVALCICVLGLMFNNNPIQMFRSMFLGNDETHTGFNFIMVLLLFLVMFVGTAATYNTFIDKDNPNYYKNNPNYGQNHKSN